MPANGDAGMMKRRATELRKGQTEAEGKIWSQLRMYRIGGLEVPDYGSG